MMFVSSELRKLRLSAAEAVFVSIKSMFPKVDLVEVRVTDLGFEIELSAAHEGPLSLIEERVKGEKIERMEMVPVSAAALLEHHGMRKRAEAVRECGLQLVTVFKMGEHVDWVTEEFADKIGAVKLLEVKGNVIVGTAYEDKKALKQALKEMKRLKPLSWEVRGKEYLCEEGWHSKGVALVQEALRFWQERQECVVKVGDKYREYFNRTGKRVFGENGVTYFFEATKDDEKTCLQLIQEIIKMFKLTCRGVKRDNRHDFFYVDVYGRESRGPFIERHEDVLIASCFGKMDEFIKNYTEGIDMQVNGES